MSDVLPGLLVHLRFIGQFWHYLQALIPRPIQGLLFLWATYFILKTGLKLSEKYMAAGQMVALSCCSFFIAVGLLLPQRFQSYVPLIAYLYCSAVITYVVHKMFSHLRELFD